MQKTIFITGASAGLGKATAKLFQKNGWNVIATMRNPEKETELNILPNVTILPLDVTNLEEINNTVKQAISIHNVDVVFNNAGYGLMGSLESLSDDQITSQLNTNLLGVIRITKAFIPHFRNNKNGVFITTTSIGGLFGFPLHSLYNAAKFAIEGWTESMSFELGMFNILIKTIAPGAIATDFAGRSLDKAYNPAYSSLENKLDEAVDSMMANASAPEKIAEIVYEAATDGKKQLRYLAGPDAEMMYARRLEIGHEGFRNEISNQFI
jgi:NAD(P)-dependent dehydrogenase (short-subunit alcohol dehydrogenase family)